VQRNCNGNSTYVLIILETGRYGDDIERDFTGKHRIEALSGLYQTDRSSLTFTIQSLGKTGQ
jgi:hypothetical protein